MSDQEIQFGRSGSEETVNFDFTKAEAEVDLLEDIKGQMRVRIEWLKPLRYEYDEMVTALNRLEGIDEPKVERPKKWTNRPSASTRKRKVGRPKGSGRRQAQVVEMLEKNPGVTALGISTALRIDRPQTHGILRNLEKSGQARQERGNKKAARWYATVDGLLGPDEEQAS